MSNQIYSNSKYQYDHQWRKLEARFNCSGQTIPDSAFTPIIWDVTDFNNIPGLTYDGAGSFTASEPMTLKCWCDIRFAIADDSGALERGLQFIVPGEPGGKGKIILVVDNEEFTYLSTVALIELMAGEAFNASVFQASNKMGGLDLIDVAFNKLLITRLDVR